MREGSFAERIIRFGRIFVNAVNYVRSITDGFSR
jgi:hypothetical protein